MATYAYIDVSQKQEFIYKNNKLIDNLHNSFIIKSITEDIAGVDLGGTSVSLSGYLEENYKAENKFVCSGGGNSIVRFNTLEQGHKFVKGYSCEVLKAYPDLELYISLVDEAEFAGDEEKEKHIREQLHEKADELKDRRQARFRRWTYGVEKIDETGQAERSKDEAARDDKLSKYYLQQRFEQKLSGTQIKITSELQHYKKDDEGKSYIGVIVIDGNKMGEMVRRTSTFRQLDEFSKEIENIYETAVINALKDYDQSLCNNKQDEKRPSLCLTPVLMAGDDICLVTEAEHGIEIAAGILRNIKIISERKKQTISSLNKFIPEDYLTGCAGVSIVKYNYPFFEAVKAAEALCHRAKESLYRVKSKDDGTAVASFIDWEILQGQVAAAAPYENFVKHRQDREVFHIKPLRIDQEAAVMESGIYSYNAFIELVKKIRREEVSSSLLEDLKKNLYSGWEQYQLFFDMRQGSEKLVKIVQEVFGGSSACNRAAWVVKESLGTSYTYILNDVLEVLPFINCQEVPGYVAESKP